MKSISRRNFLNKVSGAGIIMPFVWPIEWFEGSPSNSTGIKYSLAKNEGLTIKIPRNYD